MRRKISLDEIIKSINSETNNKSPCNDGLTAEFYKHFSNKLAAVFLMFMTPRESLAPWVLLLEQESCRSNIKKVIKKILQSTDPHTTIHKNQLKKTFRYYNR